MDRVILCIAVIGIQALIPSLTKYCGGRVVFLNQTTALSPLKNCSIIEGSLQIIGLSQECCTNPTCSLPNLVEIIGSLIIEYGNCTTDLSLFLPNLTVIRDNIPLSNELSDKFSDNYFIVRHTKLSRISLPKLTVLNCSRVALIDNPQLCYVDSLSWNALANCSYDDLGLGSKSDHKKLLRFNLGSFCPDQCPSRCRTPDSDYSVNSNCWSSTFCQLQCHRKCADQGLACETNNPSTCCDKECLGSCHGPSAEHCAACKHVELAGKCLERCPPTHYLFHGHRCITYEECMNQVPSYSDPKFSHILQNYSVINSSCVPTCPTGYSRSPSGYCVACPDSKCLRQACGDLRVYKTSDLKQVRGCVTAQSLLISIGDCEDTSASDFMDAFSNLEEVFQSVHVISADALSSLTFLRSLRIIHGMKRSGNYSASSQETSLEIAWNSQLKQLWTPKPSTNRKFKLQIRSGRLVFTLNRNLCPNQIMEFVNSSISLPRPLSPLELSLVEKSNGATAMCTALNLNVSVNVVYQRSINLEIESPTWTDIRQVLPTSVYYRHIGSDESMVVEETVCDNEWYIREPVCRIVESGFASNKQVSHTSKLECVIGPLSPAMRYQAYVEIRTMINHEGALSRIFAFTTKPDTPSSPTDLRATRMGPHKIKLDWGSPEHPNGPIVEYHIRYRRLILDPSEFMHQTSCSSGLTLNKHARRSINSSHPSTPVNYSDSPSIGTTPTDSSPSTQSSQTVCSCTSCATLCFAPIRPSTDHNLIGSSLSNVPPDLAQAERREMIRFEDSLQNLLLYPRSKTSLMRFKRSIHVTSTTKLFQSLLLAGFTHHPYSTMDSIAFNGVPKHPAHGLIADTDWEGHLKLVVEPGQLNQSDWILKHKPHSMIITNLNHYSEYMFAVFACHSPHDSNGYALKKETVVVTPEHLDQEPWCSSRAIVWQRTEAAPHVDDIDISSIKFGTEYIKTPECPRSLPSLLEGHCNENSNRINGSYVYLDEQMRDPSISSDDLSSAVSVSELTWQPPSHPNGLTLHYWIRFRRLGDENSGSSLPKWSLICIPAQDFPNLPANSNSESAEQSNAFVRLNKLRPGLYEFQLMSVSLAGNGSWTQVRQFSVPDYHLYSTWQFFKRHYFIVVIVIVFNIAVVIGVVIYFDRRAARKRLQNSTSGQKLWAVLPSDFVDEWNISPNDIHWDTDSPLGRGSFGMVYRGQVTKLTTPAASDYFPQSTTTSGSVSRNSSPKDQSQFDVAVKTMFPASTLDDVREFFREATFMKRFHSSHIVRLLGLVFPEPFGSALPVIVLEYMAHGDLATYLRRRMSKDDCTQGSIQPQLAVNWAAQLADGMAYIASLQMVHRDLAARNCLVDSQLTVKIGDFGLARQLNHQEYYRKLGQGCLPIRWMSPESLSSPYFYSKSDVWSYGVVLWEIATFASLPYPGLSNEEVITYVTDGGRLNLPDCPSKFPSILLTIMNKCWAFDPANRPTFIDILTDLEPYVNAAFRSVSFYQSQQPISTTQSDQVIVQTPVAS